MSLSGRLSLQGSRKSSAEFSSSLSAPETGVNHTASHKAHFLANPQTPARSHTFDARPEELSPHLRTLSFCHLCSLLHLLLFIQPPFDLLPPPLPLFCSLSPLSQFLRLIIRARHPRQRRTRLKCCARLLHFILHTLSDMSR